MNYVRSGMPVDSLVPDSGPGGSSSSPYSIGGVAYASSGSTTVSASSTGDRGEGGAWDSSIDCSTVSAATARGDNGSYSTTADTTSSSHTFWHAWGSGSSISFEVTSSYTYDDPSVLRLLSQPSLFDDKHSHQGYDFQANGTVVDGVTVGTYTLTGDDKSHYSFAGGISPDSGGSGTDAPTTSQGFSFNASTDQEVKLDQAGTAQALTHQWITSTESDHDKLTAWAGDLNGGARVTSTTSGGFTLTRSLGNGGSGTPDGTKLEVHGSEDNSATIWEGDGSSSSDNPDDPNYPGGAPIPPTVSYCYGLGTLPNGLSPADYGAALMADGPPGGNPPGGPPAGGNPPVFPSKPPKVMDFRDSWYAGWQFLAGSAPLVTYYGYDSLWTQELSTHQAIQPARDAAIAQLKAGTATPGTSDNFKYDLSGLSGAGVFLRDVGHGAGAVMGGMIRDPAYYGTYFDLAFLGSFSGSWEVLSVDKAARTATIQFIVFNPVTVESATRVPWFGYRSWFPIKSFVNPASVPHVVPTLQVFHWTEVVKW